MAARAIGETDDAPSMSSKRRTEPAVIIEASNASTAWLVRKACRAVLDGAPEVSDAWLFATDIAEPTESAAATTVATVEAAGAPSPVGSLWSAPEVPAVVCEPLVASADRPSAVASPSASPAGFSVVASRSGAGGGSCWTTGGAGSPAGGVTSATGGVCSAGGGFAAAGGVSSGGGGASAGGGVSSGGGGLSATGGVSSAGGELSTAGGVSSGGGALSATGGCSGPPGGGVGSAAGTASSEPEGIGSVAGGACSPATASVVASGEFVSNARASPTKRPTNRREPASASDATSRRAIERPSEGASSGGFSSSVIMKRSQGSVGYRHIRS
jgi:hypothetical protein